MDQGNGFVRYYSICASIALLRPIARLMGFIAPLALTQNRVNELAEKCGQDPGLPSSNPTKSYWQQPPHPSLSDIQSRYLLEQTDVLIIGSGVTAASTAFHLLSKDPDITITIAEARTITSGGTGRNGGHILEIPYDEYGTHVALLGEQAARELVQFRLSHLEEMLEFAKTRMSRKDMKESEIRVVEFVDAIFDEERWVEAKQNLKDFFEAFPDQVDKWRMWEGKEARERFGMPQLVGAVTGPSGALWPYKFITNIYADLMAAYPTRISIETSTPVLDIKASEKPDQYAYTSLTSRGSIKSNHIVHATNGHVGHLIPGMRGKVFPLRGQMTAQKLSGLASSSSSTIGGVGTGGRSWLLRHGRGYDYMTQHPETGMFFLGGGLVQGDNCGHDDIGNPSDERENFLARAHLSGILGQLFEGASGDGQSTSVVSSWSGVMGFSCDGLPWVGRLPHEVTERRPVSTASTAGGEWIAAGFCGMGMVYCWRSGQALASMILGENSDILPVCLNPSLSRFKASSVATPATQWISMLLG